MFYIFVGFFQIGNYDGPADLIACVTITTAGVMLWYVDRISKSKFNALRKKLNEKYDGKFAAAFDK